MVYNGTVWYSVGISDADQLLGPPLHTVFHLATAPSPSFIRYVRPCTLVRICDECNYGSYQGRCVIDGGPGVSDAYYCKVKYWIACLLTV